MKQRKIIPLTFLVFVANILITPASWSQRDKPTDEKSVAAPTISPDASHPFNKPQSVTLSTTTPNATLCYSTDDRGPACNVEKTGCTSGALYSAPFTLADNSTLKVLACKKAMQDSPLVSAPFVFDTLAPKDVTEFKIKTSQEKVELQWINPTDADFAGVKILRKTEGVPANATDGTLVFSGEGVQAADTLPDEKVYYYKVFAFDSASNYAPGVEVRAQKNVGTLSMTVGLSGGPAYGQSKLAGQDLKLLSLHLGAAYGGLFSSGFLKPAETIALVDAQRFAAKDVPAWGAVMQVGVAYPVWKRDAHLVTALVTGGYAFGQVDGMSTFGVGVLEVGARYAFLWSESLSFVAGLRQQFYLDPVGIFLATQVVVGAAYRL